MDAKKSQAGRAQPQIDGFKQAAREIGCDESEAHFDRALGKVANAPPDKPERKSKKRKLDKPA
jgi:hypothetical protein